MFIPLPKETRSALQHQLFASSLCLLIGCGGGGTDDPAATVTPTISPTRVARSTATPVPTATASPSPTATSNGVISIAAAVARDANGLSLALGQMVTVEGIVTVSAGVFANNKLKIFAQEGDAGILIYHPSSADVPAVAAGQRIRATGEIRQIEPMPDSNPAAGTVQLDVSTGSLTILSSDNLLPSEQEVQLDQLQSRGPEFTGEIVHIIGGRKVSGEWPTAGSRSTSVSISDDGGISVHVLRLQRNTITEQLANKLASIGDGTFNVTGIVVQDDRTDDARYLSDFEIWLRSADDVAPGSE